jgi:hypothetical protein
MGLPPHTPVLSTFYPQLNLLNSPEKIPGVTPPPPPLPSEKYSWVRHCLSRCKWDNIHSSKSWGPNIRTQYMKPEKWFPSSRRRWSCWDTNSTDVWQEQAQKLQSAQIVSKLYFSPTSVFMFPLVLCRKYGKHKIILLAITSFKTSSCLLPTFKI